MSRKFSWRTASAALLLIPALGLTACSSQGGRAPEPDASAQGAVADTPRLKVAMITHAPAGDTFWDIVRKGAEAAAAKDNIDLQYLSDPEGGNQAQLIGQAVDQGVDGIAVTLAKPDAVAGALAKAKAAGIPITSLNGGEDRYKELGAFANFGSNERAAGEAVGQKLLDENYKKPICVIQVQGHVGLEARCAGVKSKIPATEVLYVQGTDMTQVQSTTTAKLQTSKDVDVIIGLGAPISLTLLKSVAEANSSAKVASFDMNAEMAQKIVDGEILFTVDQQPWLQGYESIDAIWLDSVGGFALGGGQPVPTGPSIVDTDNAKAVLKFAEEGLR